MFCYYLAFKEFRNICLKYYKLDPCHYFNSWGLSWDAMIKMVGVKLHPLSDIDRYLFVKKSMKGGRS